MREVKKYISFSGGMFDDKEECIKCDNLYNKLEALDSKLEPKPKADNCNFSNGEGYLQQNPQTVNDIMRKIIKLAPELDSKITPDIISLPFDYRNSIIGRILCDSNSIVCRYWNRFMNMDDNYKEYGQGYFALNPHKAKQICLNKELKK